MKTSAIEKHDALPEIATVLASGFLRWRKRRQAHAGTSPNPEAPSLEVSPDTVLSVTNPVNGPESPKHGEPA
jgi:hypothetical protein